MYTLLDAVQQNKENPDTFHIPSKLEILTINEGTIVKLCFSEPGVEKSERMWVQVTKADIENDEYEGLLDNDPYKLKSIKYQDKVKFKAKNILAIY